MKPRPVSNWNRRLAECGWWHSMELPGGESVAGVRSLEELRACLARFPIPANLAGLRVLDIGAWDGWFSFEMERRGAEVTAVDCWDNPRFRYAHRRLGSHVDYRIADVYTLTPARVGRFDIVLFFGVLYHLKHPLLALEKVCALATGMACIESHVMGRGRKPLMEFYETDELSGQTDNWNGPNLACLLAFCRTAGFARVIPHGVVDGRAHVTGFRHWEPAGTAPAPELLRVAHNTGNGINFSSERDDYVSCWFRTGKTPRREDVWPEVSGYGTAPLYVGLQPDGAWQANFKLPPGLEPGWHEVRVRVARSEASAPLAIAVDVPATAAALAVTGLCDGVDWRAGVVAHGVVSLWVAGLPANADCSNVRVVAGERELKVEYIAPRGDEPRQVNARMEEPPEPGVYELSVGVGDIWSPPATFRVP